MNNISVRVLHFVHLNFSTFLKHFAFSIDIMGNSASNNKIHQSVTSNLYFTVSIGCIGK